MKISSLSFDPRSKLVVVLFASLLLMLHFSLSLELLFMTLVLLLFWLEGSFKKGLFCYLGYLFVLFISDYLTRYLNHPLLTILSFGFIAFRRFSPIIMTAVFASNKTQTSQWLATLKKWHVPLTIMVPLAVLFRFFPTFIQDFKDLRNAMKYRGIMTRSVDIVLHPFQTLEYLVVPILMSTENISLDLSASALTRGLGNDTQQTSIYPIKFHWYDYCLLLAVAGLFILGVFA